MTHEQQANALDAHSEENPSVPIAIILDGNPVEASQRRLNGRQIRELGPKDRVDGFETQEVDERGKKIKTIPDDRDTELHRGERFRTVPNRGGPGANT